MSKHLRTVIRVVSVVSMGLVCVGTTQAAPTTWPVPNYNFQNWTVYQVPSYNVIQTVPPLADGQQTPPLSSGVLPTVDYWDAVYGANQASYAGWNPTAADFGPSATGNGVLPGTAAGNICLYDNATMGTQGDIGFINADQYGDPTGICTLNANKRYTATIAMGSPLTATIMNGDSFTFNDMTAAVELPTEYDDLYPNGYTKATSQQFLRTGTFGDVSISMSGSSVLGYGNGTVRAGDQLVYNFNPCAGTAWSNVRMISQNWYPMYTSGTGNWESSTWSTTSASGYTKPWAQVSGHDADAVFEGTGGTVTVSTTVNANSLSFMTDSTMAGYTIQGSGTINLTGDAIITCGAGTDNVAGNMYGQTTVNQGGGANTISCVLAGTAGMYKAGGGTLILTGANTYINSADRTSDTTVGGGTLQIGNGGASGSITGNVNNLANLAFNHSGTFVFGGNIKGTGSVDIASTATGGGATVFTGAHTYTGVTTVHADNTLQLGNGGATGSITGDVIVNAATATLAFNHSNTLTYAGSIYGAGSVTQLGAGKTILSGVNSYTGATTISNGTLALGANNALPTGSSMILAGGTFATDGFSQTNSLGSLTLSGNSVIDMGGVSSVLKYADSHLMSWLGTLTITDWNGSLTGGGADELILGSSASALTLGQLSEIIFVHPDGLAGNYQATILPTGEIVPVPEPSTLALLGIGAAGLLAYAWRRQTRTA